MKKLYILLFLILCLLFCSCTANSDNEIKYITEHYKNAEISTFWDVTALCYAGQDMSNYNVKPFIDSQTDITNYSDVSGRIIGLKMLENSGYDISGCNLDLYIDALLEMTRQDDEAGYSLSYLQRIYGIYALRLTKADYPESKVIDYAKHIVSLQCQDGGFSTFSNQGDVDTTSFVIPLLVHFKDQENFDVAIGKATIFLRNSKNKDDTYSCFGVSNSNTTANALSAFMALGFTEKDADIGDISLALATFRLPDGSYSYEKYSTPNMLSCAQALIAYCDFQNKSSLWLSILRQENHAVETVILSVTDAEGNMICDNIEKQFSSTDTALDILINHCKDNKIPYTLKNGYIASLAGISEFDYGPESGWIYTVNGESATVGCNSYYPKANDVIMFKYITSYEDIL